ncbi:HNH endonuclease [Pseudolysinimonas yzui]|uniref:HNH endonuclease n=1 Tax=Pseudolysinimonas yzui TaxID=2708254 RepID=A0A8J3GRC1_9MICO|nr:HNH endonuclease [Pseudolysinimonas yzui]GHF18481.1 HNH endonuclease [Pseudolysinimonas yzui]
MTIDRSRRARAARKRRRRFLAADNDLTPAQWTAIRVAWGGCAYCGASDASLQKDCVLPLSRGGRYTLDNVVPACRSCNASKSNDEVTGWLRRKRLDEPRFLLRWAQIVVDLRTRLSESEDFIDVSSTTTTDSES